MKKSHSRLGMICPRDRQTPVLLSHAPNRHRDQAGTLAQARCGLGIFPDAGIQAPTGGSE